LDRLIQIAKGATGQRRKVAKSLLVCVECRSGGFDVTDLWGVDAPIAADTVTVFAVPPVCRHYPDTLGDGREFETIVRARSAERS
jgi:hypothetical protein